MKNKLSSFISGHRRLWNTFLFLFILLTAFSFRTYHYNTSVLMLNEIIREVPQQEQDRRSFFELFLPLRHNNFSPFTIESAMMYSYSQDIAEGKACRNATRR